MTQPDMSQLLAQAQQMQAQLQAAQQEILNSKVTGSAPHDLVVVEMQGDGKVVNITIDPKVVDPDDVETLQDLLVGAVNQAHANLAQLAEQKMGPLSQGFEGMGGMF